MFIMTEEDLFGEWYRARRIKECQKSWIAWKNRPKNRFTSFLKHVIIKIQN